MADAVGQPLIVSISHAEDSGKRATVVTAIGYIDLSTVELLREQVDRILEQQPALLIFDLSGVTFLASAGLQNLAETHSAMIGDRRLIIVANGHMVLRPLQLTGFDKMLHIVPTIAAALASG